jgi:hypothetical protein
MPSIARYLLVTLAAFFYTTSSNAQTAEASIENAPCEWFVRKSPGLWGTDHAVSFGNFTIGKMSFGKGALKLPDGRDPYDVVEQKCGGKPPNTK